MKLSEYQENKVYLHEYALNKLGYDKNSIEYETKDAIKYIALRKCINMPLPYVFDKNGEELDTIDIEPCFE